MKTGIIYLPYLLTFIALVTFTQAYAPVDSGNLESFHRAKILIPVFYLKPNPTGDPVTNILSSASFDFSFTATIRDSLRHARSAAVKQAIRRHVRSARSARSAIRVTDRRLATEMLSMMSLDAHPIDPVVVKRRVAPWEQYIEKYSRKYNIDPNLIRAIIYTESSGNPDVVSYRGAMGLMQLMPDTVEFVGIADPFDPEQNILGGARYITWISEYAPESSEAYLLWAWHAGPAMPERLLLPNTTRDFILKVLDVKRRLERSGNPV